MKHYLPFLHFLILPFLLSRPSYSNQVSYEVIIDAAYSEVAGVTSVICSSHQELGKKRILAEKNISPGDKIVRWPIEEEGYDHHTVQRCRMRDEKGNVRFSVTAFDGSWKLNQIIWKLYTFDDFIFNPQNGKRFYLWVADEHGVFLYNFKTKTYERVVPLYNYHKPLAAVFVSNFFNDKRNISIICLPNKEPNDGFLANVRELRHKQVVGWSVPERHYFEGKVHTCHLGWKNEITGKSHLTLFSAFNDSWGLDEIIRQSDTLMDFTFNTFSRENNYLWGVSENGLSLYNFKAKEYQVVGSL